MSAIVHGGRLDAAIAEYGGKRDNWLDLSTGINPNPYSIPEVTYASWQRLPDEGAHTKLITAARKYYKVPEEYGLVASNGTQAIIQSLPQILAQEKIAIVSPTYEEHFHCWKLAGREVVKVQTLNEGVECADIVVVVNPNNPTAVKYQPDELSHAAQKLERKSGILIVDEAFGDVMPELSTVPIMSENTIVLRSFGKFFGLAGLRLGFAIASKTVSGELKLRLGPWCVSGPALDIGATAFRDQRWIENSRIQIKQNSEDQVEVVEACGLKLIGNAGLFMEFEHQNTLALHEALLKEYILVRPFSARPTRLRFGLCKNMEELERFALALKRNV